MATIELEDEMLSQGKN